MKLKANTEVVLYKLPSKFLPLFNSQKNLAHTGRVWSCGITVLQAAAHACLSKPGRHKPWAPCPWGRGSSSWDPQESEHCPGLSWPGGKQSWRLHESHPKPLQGRQVYTQDNTAGSGSYCKEQQQRLARRGCPQCLGKKGTAQPWLAESLGS